MPIDICGNQTCANVKLIRILFFVQCKTAQYQAIANWYGLYGYCIVL